MTEMETVNLASDAPQVRVERFIRQWLETAPASEALPSEREIAKRLEVGRTTVRRALATLAREGLLKRDGRRLRQAAPGGVAATGILARTIVMFLPQIEEQDETVRAHWTEYGSLGCARALRLAGLNGLALTEQNVDLAEVGRILSASPMGFVIPDAFLDPSNSIAAAEAVSKAGVPLVVYGGDPNLSAYDRVLSDHEAGSAMLVRHFASKGYKRIANFWPRPWDRYWFVARQRGYEKAMREAGLQPMPTLESSAIEKAMGSREQFHKQVKYIAGYLVPVLTSENPPEVLLCGSDRDVAYVVAACRLFGRKPGQDIQIAGYDAYYQMCEELAFEPTAPAATIHKRNALMGEDMVRMLLDRIEGRLPEGPQMQVVEPSLVIPAEENRRKW